MNIVLLPYHFKIDYLIDSINIANKDNIVSIVAGPAFFDALKKDSRCINNNIEIVDSLDKVSRAYDAIVFFSDMSHFIKDAQNQIQIAKARGETIIDLSMDVISSQVEKESLYNIDIPIITINKSNPKIKTLKFLASLKSKMDSEGYNTSVISSENGSELLGYFDLSYIVNKSIALDEKIKMFNNAVFDIVKQNNTQILIVDIPSDVYDEYVLVIQQALRCDYNIVLTEAFRSFKNYSEMLENKIKYLYYGQVNEIIMSEYVVDFLQDDYRNEFPLTESSLKKLCETKLTTYDVEQIYNKIKKFFSNIEVI